jgi:inhibitor of cysteine peptidase
LNKNTTVISKPQFTLQQFQSCDEVSSVLSNFIKENADYFKGRYGGGYPMPMMIRGAMEDTVTTANLMAKSSESIAGWAPFASSTNDFSTTNNQVKGVDEPDIMKTDGKHIYYVNERTHEINIIKSPLNGGNGLLAGSINLDSATLINSLTIPSSFYNTQLFLQGSTLIIIGNRYRENAWRPGFLDTNSRITVMMFDMTDPSKPQFLTLKDLAWNLNDMRLLDEKLVIIHSLYSNRGWAYDYWNRGMKINSTLALPSSLDISKSTTTMKIGQKSYPLTKSLVTPDCSAISYALPNTETLKHYNIDPNFTLITTIDIKNPATKINQQVTIGNTQTIHVSKKNLYLTQPIYSPTSYSCPFNARCMMPRFNAGQQTLIHKFSLGNTSIYKASNIIQWSPLNQYSMSEDADGNFRLLTTEWNEKQMTHLFTLDDDLKPLGKLLNIEPGETFQSSRFIDDKLYLVTFQQIDPLFVIDLKNLKNPIILGELKIPGYSTYLHPWGKKENNVQYLIGLGYDTGTGSRGWTVNSGIKVDLYKIDYNTKDSKGNISITQHATKTLWSMDSQTEATYNPRTFVWDDTRKQLLLALSLTKSERTQQCTVNYDSMWKEFGKQCYPQDTNKVIFAGIKLFCITPDTGITEKISYDYQELLKKDSNYISESNKEINPRQFISYMNRVGYAGDVIYTINQLFGHFGFINGSQEKYVELK